MKVCEKNEKVAKIAKDMRKKADDADFACCGNVDASFVRWYADRVEAANEREIAELRECLKEAVFVMQTLFDKQMPKWRKALEGAKDAGK